jgi:hypothetical protein
MMLPGRESKREFKGFQETIMVEAVARWSDGALLLTVLILTYALLIYLG